MGFIKYSVLELGVEETLPGWIKQSSKAESEVKDDDLETANKSLDDDSEENQTKE
jgi:hypothetical protein